MDMGLIGGNFIFFVIILGVLVTVHEYGHFWVARRHGIIVEIFSIGFGPELCGWIDKQGTKWRLAAIPLGGYVKFLGDMNAASYADQNTLQTIPKSQWSGLFALKPLWIRAAVVLAGPAANFLLAWLLIAGLLMLHGQPKQPSVIPAVASVVLKGSPAEEAGLQAGDLIVSLDNKTMNNFSDVSAWVRDHPGEDVKLVIERAGVIKQLDVEIGIITAEDGAQVGRLGVVNQSYDLVRMGPALALFEGGQIIWNTAGLMLVNIWEMVSGQSSVKDLGGLLRIAEYSGESARIGIFAFINFMAFMSINLGLLNLLPIPVLDGGHLAMYGYECIRGRPLGQKTQEFSFRVGLILIITLMVIVNGNDIVRILSNGS